MESTTLCQCTCRIWMHSSAVIVYILHKLDDIFIAYILWRHTFFYSGTGEQTLTWRLLLKHWFPPLFIPASACNCLVNSSERQINAALVIRRKKTKWGLKITSYSPFALKSSKKIKSCYDIFFKSGGFKFLLKTAVKMFHREILTTLCYLLPVA